MVQAAKVAVAGTPIAEEDRLRAEMYGLLAVLLARPPSAELAPDQKDQDSLPPYEILDPIIELYVEKDQCIDAIVAQGFDKEVVVKVVKLINQNEYKRRQAAPGVRISERAFGRDRRYPITSGFVRDPE